MTYTPAWIVREMIRWAAAHGTPDRVVDAGAGTGIFSFAAAAAFPVAQVVAVEIEPASADHLRQRVRASEYASRIEVLEVDYLELPALPSIEGRTLFIGNPPYVRHHLIDARKKQLYLELSREFNLHPNTKAGLHLHFFLKTRKLAKRGDYGVFIAAAEWIHADYGSALRALLLDGMGGLSVDTFAAKNLVFPQVMTTAAVVCFEVGSRSSAIAFSEISDQTQFTIGSGSEHCTARLLAAKHWSRFARGEVASVDDAGTVRLKEIFRVKRGQVTGAKPVWVHGAGAPDLPANFLYPAVTRAKEILTSRGEIVSGDGLQLVVDLPLDLDSLSDDDRTAAERFRAWAEQSGAADTYIARQRPRWWSVQLYDPAPILCTYMGRRPPAFAVNSAGVRHLNIAHGLYPRGPMTTEEARRLDAESDPQE